MIDIEHLHFYYKSFVKEQGFKGTFKDLFHRQHKLVHSIKDVNLHIEQGERIGLLGPNGAGKTTLIKLMVGIVQPASGSIRCMGYDPFLKEHDYLRQIGVVLGQKTQLQWDLPAFDTLEVLKHIYKIPQDRYEKHCDRMLSLLGLTQKSKIPVRKLSLGERMKFELMCSLIHQPRVVFLDEPTIGLDLHSQRNIHEFLRQINEEDKTTIILTSHYMKDIEAVCDRVVLIVNGEKCEDEPLPVLVRKYAMPEDMHQFQITFLEHLPYAMDWETFDARVSGERQVMVPEHQLRALLERLDLAEVERIERSSKGFEDVIFDIYTASYQDQESAASPLPKPEDTEAAP